MSDIGEVIKNARIKNGISQTKLAEAVGRSPQLICDIEAGRKSPSLKTLKGLIVELKLPPSEIFLE